MENSDSIQLLTTNQIQDTGEITADQQESDDAIMEYQAGFGEALQDKLPFSELADFHNSGHLQTMTTGLFGLGAAIVCGYVVLILIQRIRDAHTYYPYMRHNHLDR